MGELFDYISEHSSVATAAGFIGQIRPYCLGLSIFPERGMGREDIGAGIRVVGFRRRVSIVFSVPGADVWILGIHYGGRLIAPWAADVGTEL